MACCVVVIGVPTSLIGPSLASADATTTVAFYSMDEPSPATVLIDSTPNHINGTIGADVTTSIGSAGAISHRFKDVDPDALPANVEHLDRVPHDARLNPDGADFAVTVRYRTTRSFGNIVQKGQNQTVGGYFKFEAPTGHMTCLFKGSLGQQRALTSPQALNDGIWHTVRCERLASGLTMYVDGVLTLSLPGPTGTIANDKNLSIGGKTVCDQIVITCDYFVCDIDFIRLEKGSGGPANQPPAASFAPTCAGLICTFSAAGSTDADGAIQTYAWSYGDGVTEPPTAQAVFTSHVYAQAGTFPIELTITDDRGATAMASTSVTVAPISELISFVGQATAYLNVKRHTVTIPANVQVGDGLILFFSENSHSAMTEPAGWLALDSVAGGFATTRTWRKVATVADAGSTVQIDLVTQSKGAMTVLAYRGTSLTDPVSASASKTDTATTTTRQTPFATVTVAQSWAVSYWMHGDSLSGALTPPAGLAVRAAGTHTGGGRVTTLIADANASIPLGGFGGLVATAPNASSTTASFTLILAPAVAVPNLPPVAVISSTCTALHCDFSGVNSSDADGMVNSFEWNFGDGTSASGRNVAHDFLQGGTYTVTLTVVDDDLAPGSVSNAVVVAPPPPMDVIIYVGQSMANVNAVNIATTVPSGVLAGDGLLMFLSENTVATISEPVGVKGWALLDSKTAGTTTTRVWRKVASAEDAAAAVSLTLSATSKANLIVVAYRGTALTDPVVSFASAASVAVSTTRTTPSTLATAPNWVVSYWMHRDSTSTALVAPVGVVARATGSQTGSGRVTCLVADSAMMVPTGPYGDATATAAANGGAATMWTIVLAPLP